MSWFWKVGQKVRVVGESIYKGETGIIRIKATGRIKNYLVDLDNGIRMTTSGWNLRRIK